MKVTFRKRQSIAVVLTVVLLMGTFGAFNANAQWRSQGYYRDNHHSRAKGAIIGGAAGLLGGALLGGGRGALIGAGAGAGAGYLIQRHRNHHYRRYYGRY
jgi:YMGG-like Gly-zipper